MKVFISWSGDTSHEVAIALHKWLPGVIQSITPYVSSKDLDKGTRWSTDISKELQDSSFGILCVTEDNVDAPWLLFEAGALSKSVDKGRVAPFLFGVKRSDIKGPLIQFQSTMFDKEDVGKLIHSLNKTVETTALDETHLTETFEVWWPRLEEQLNEIEDPSSRATEPTESASGGHEHSSEILEELLELIRHQHRILNSPDELLPRSYLESAVGRMMDHLPSDHPAYIDLRRAWTECEEAILLLDDKESLPSQLVKDLLFRLRDPVSYILDNAGSHRRRRRRMRD